MSPPTGPGGVLGTLAAQPAIFDAATLSACISCGFCLPACPTYALTKDERSSPRGRITLMRALQEGWLAGDDPTLREQSSFCLGCRACEPVCPAGVQYGQLLEQWRDHQWRGRRVPLKALVLRVGVRLRPLLGVAGRLRRAASTSSPEAEGSQPSGAQLMLGCAERVLFPGVSRAVRRLVPGLRIPAKQGCCGALHAHNGASAQGERMARALGAALPGQILTTSGGCAAHLVHVLGRDRVTELSEHLHATAAAAATAATEPAATEPGATESGATESGATESGATESGATESGATESGATEPGATEPGATEPGATETGATVTAATATGVASPVAGSPAAQAGQQVSVAGRRARVAIQDSCHLRNGLGTWREPRALAATVADVVELPSAATCCGAAGTYALLRPRDSQAVLDPKLDEVEAADIDYLVVVNPGCQRQLIGGLRRRRSGVRVLHLAELLAMAATAPPAPSRTSSATATATTPRP